MHAFHKFLAAAAIAGAALSLPQTAAASSHREAPAIAEDQFVDNTDVYTFISPDNPDNLVIVANYVPLLLPQSGPNFYRFSDQALYAISLDNDGDAVPDIKYVFDFDTTTDNGGTFLYNTGPITSIDADALNVKQRMRVYRVEREDDGNITYDKVGENIPVAPWYVGDRSFPDGSYEEVARGGIADLSNGAQVFAGPRDEPFFVDLHVFDLLGVGGAPTTDGVNVMSIVLEVPIDDVANDGERPAEGDDGLSSVVGVYAKALRPRITVRRSKKEPLFGGGWVQVSRLGWPLVNEVIVPLQDKDKYNRSNPVDDVANFGAYILDPEVPVLLDAVLGVPCPPAPEDGRLDIVGLLGPNGTAPADLLRINITQGQTFDNSGFPNGRTLTDDVTDTLLTVACNLPGDEGLTPIGDGVDANDLPFFDEMPYLATPHSGNPL
ncbi:MAG: DUF4331 domain-containing protein [Myxococcota bacterium]